MGDGSIVKDQKMEILPSDGFDHEFNQLRVNLEDESNRQKGNSLQSFYEWIGGMALGSNLEPCKK